ncbi:hypothetical protein [Dyella sp. RRB7]|uniref:hypothetical protein n=1 Tax=Dyella sp. RRB7 TaxID=2919502 RepID=UPI001FA949ED|nr:hypothetical protein [Dyella sp. RRB7]
MASIARWVIGLACLGMAACSQQAMLDKLTPHQESEYAQQVLGDLRAHHLDQVKANLDGSLQQLPDIDAKLEQTASYFPSGEPESVKIVGSLVQVRAGSDNPDGRRTFDLTYEYEFADGWALANVHMYKIGDALHIDGIHVQRMSQSLEQQNTFTLAGKDAAHWIMVLLAGAMALFCLYAFVRCLCTPIARRKWLWAIFTLFGIGTLRFNWNTGAFDVQLLSVQLFSASASSQNYAPWIVGVSFPLGAIWFLWRRKSLIAASPLPDTADPKPLGQMEH